MIYNSFSFITLFPFLFLLYYIIPTRYDKGRNLFLLATSYALYIQWRPVFVLILLGVTLITYWGGQILQLRGDGDEIKNDERKRRKKLVCLFAIMGLLPLLFFKYYNFINNCVSNGLTFLGFQSNLPGLNWAIPIGISFFTFQALGYMLDVYHGRINAERNFLDYALFVSFFPSILSGPINKASLILPQIKNLRQYFDYDKAVIGLKMLLWGMFMKVVVADRVGLYVDTVLLHYENYNGITCLIASVFYTIQIYADFAGYSLMAIGVGKVLGFELTENFHRPYFAVSVTDFWRRWHISLSTWLKDYVYIPLGGSRCSKLRNYWNIFVTFLVSGIWHGANWTFIVWGIWHGLFQIIEKAIGQQKCEYGWFGKTVKIIITFLLVNFAWIFFRMPTIGDAFCVLARIFDFSLPKTVFVDTTGKTGLLLYMFGIGTLFAKDIHDEFFQGRVKLFNNKRAIVRWFTYLVVISSILLLGVFGADQFIYVNF